MDFLSFAFVRIDRCIIGLSDVTKAKINVYLWGLVRKVKFISRYTPRYLSYRPEVVHHEPWRLEKRKENEVTRSQTNLGTSPAAHLTISRPGCDAWCIN